MIQFPCSACGKPVKNNQAAIFCDHCNLWSHCKCNGITSDTYIRYVSEPDNVTWTSNACISSALPFNDASLNNSNITDAKGNPDKLASLKLTLEQLNHAKDFAEIFDSKMGIGGEDDHGIDCKYVEIDNFHSLNLDPKKSLSFFHLNIASLPAHFDELNQLMTLPGFGFDIIGITESKIKEGTPTFNHTLPHYAFEHTISSAEKGGAALYIFNRVKYTRRSDIEKLCYLSKKLESTFIELHRKNKKNIIVGCIYRHPCMTVDAFNNDFLTPTLQKCISEKKSIVLLGDFNIDLLNPHEIGDINIFTDIIGSFSLLPQIILPTRITSVSHTLIDNIFCSSDFTNTMSGNILTAISDHLSQFLIIHDQQKVTTELYKTVRDWSKFDTDTFARKISELDWNQILLPLRNDVNLSFNRFFDTIDSLLEESAPLKKVQIHEMSSSVNPWITRGLLNSIKIRNKLHKSYLGAKNPESKSFYLERFKKYRNAITSLCRVSKNNYYQSYFRENSANISKVWKGINSLLGRKVRPPAPSSILIGEETETDPQIIANTFNEFYASIAEEIRAEIPRNPRSFSAYLRDPNPRNLFLSPVTKNEVICCISNLDSSKASGPYSIPSCALSAINTTISGPLSVIINLSFSNGVFPDRLKISDVLPSYKKHSKLSVSNYRPISLLSNLDKIFEKLIYKRTYDFLQQHNVFFQQQFGFRKKHSTSHAILNMIQKIMDALDKGEFACGVFVDLQKAFDTVDHKILLKKLSHYGVRGVSLDLFKSYLSGRSQFVTVNGVSSNKAEIRHGVPQGSVLGPLLFLIYINDLHHTIYHSVTHHFADDTNLVCFGKSLKSLNNKINNDLRYLTRWLNANKISLHAGKTEYLLFNSHKPPDWDFVVKLCGKRILPSNHIKYLGILIDSDLKFGPHINAIATKLKNANCILARLRHLVPREIS